MILLILPIAILLLWFAERYYRWHSTPEWDFRGKFNQVSKNVHLKNDVK